MINFSGDPPKKRSLLRGFLDPQFSEPDDPRAPIQQGPTPEQRAALAGALDPAYLPEQYRDENRPRGAGGRGTGYRPGQPLPSLGDVGQFAKRAGELGIDMTAVGAAKLAGRMGYDVTGAIHDRSLSGVGKALAMAPFIAFPELKAAREARLAGEAGQAIAGAERGLAGVRGFGVATGAERRAANLGARQTRIAAEKAATDAQRNTELARAFGVAGDLQPEVSRLKLFNTNVAPKARAFVDPENVVQERVRKAWNTLDLPLPPSSGTPPGKFVDRSRIILDTGPTQADLPVRPWFGPKQSTGHMQALADPENLALARAQAERGGLIMPNTFYPSVVPVSEAIEQAGGNRKLWNDVTTAAAIRSGPEAELVSGSALNWALKQGHLTEDELQYLLTHGGNKEAWGDIRNRLRLSQPGLKQRNWETGNDPWESLADRIRFDYAQAHPKAPGLQMMGAHPRALAARMLGVEPESFKIPMYGAQKEADVPGFVLDTHESKGGTLASPHHRRFMGQGGFQSQGEYGYQEQLYRKLARDMGLSDRAFQEARWRGGGDITGLESVPNMDYAHIFENLLIGNAEKRGLDPRRLLEEVAQGRNVFYRPVLPR